MAVDVIKAMRAAPLVKIELGGSSFSLKTLSGIPFSEAVEYVEMLSVDTGLEWLIREDLKKDAAGRAVVLSMLTPGVTEQILNALEEASGMQMYDILVARHMIAEYPEDVMEDLNRVGKNFSDFVKLPAWEVALFFKAALTTKVERSSTKAAHNNEQRAWSFENYQMFDLWWLMFSGFTHGKKPPAYHRLPKDTDIVDDAALEDSLAALNEGAEYETMTEEQLDEYMDIVLKVQAGELPPEALDPWRQAAPETDGDLNG